MHDGCGLSMQALRPIVRVTTSHRGWVTNGVSVRIVRSRPRVLVVDDDGLVRGGLRALLEREGFEVTDATSGEQALRRIARFPADIVIMDADLPGMSGVEAMRHLVARAPTVSVLMLAVVADQAAVVEALRAGGAGFLLRDVEPAAIVAGVRALAGGHAVIDPRVAGVLVAELRRAAAAVPAASRPASVVLSERERAVLKLLSRGWDNAEIGRHLYVSPSTVKTDVSRLFEKLGVENRVQAATYAIRHGVGAEAGRAAA
jgi:DNA-binding NarL/FixJ family response regulator